MRARAAARALAVAGACAIGALGAAPAAAADAAANPVPFPQIAILCYHHIAEEPGGNTLTVTPTELREQLRACREQGWTVVPLSELLERREQPEKLPARTLVVMFDDGYCSFVEKALPILRAEGLRASLAAITSFPGTERSDMPPLIDWDELRRLKNEDGIEIVAHSHALHAYETASPQGVTVPSVYARRWLAGKGDYEDRERYRNRIGDDLSKAQRAFREELGSPTSVLVWPFGAHNEMARAQAEHAGFEVTLALEHRLVTAEDLRSGCLPRFLVHRGMRFARNPDWYREPLPPVRMARVELDEVWNRDLGVMNQRLDEAVTRARAVGANSVMIPVFAAPERDGRLRASFAMNHQSLVAADVWAFAANRFREAGFRVWAVVPTMNLTWVWDRAEELRVPERLWPQSGRRWSTKLSPDLTDARRAAVDLVTDLAVYLPMDGMVFDDDATLGPKDKLALNGSQDPAAKAAAIRTLLDECKQAVRAWRPECRFGRIAPQGVIERPGLNTESSMSLEAALERDELVISPLRAPRSGSSAHIVRATTEKLARRAAERWYGLGRGGEVPIVFLIPSLEAGTGRAVPEELQVAMARALNHVGLSNSGSLAPAAGGELPLGLLQSRDPIPAVRAARKD
jgi:biofilm PGA synthesis lipoprotein PgaB